MTDKELEAAARAEKELVEDVKSDFAKRQEERRRLERSWQLNMNFLCGNQYCDLNSKGEIEDEPIGYFWQTKRVFNYIAPTIDTRCAKLGRIRPKLAVRAASDDEADMHSAQISSAILAATCEDCDVDGKISEATVWSETCGTAFYKIVWDNSAGREIAVTGDGVSVKEGGVKIIAVPPFEIYPYTLSEESVEAQPSIIHARAVAVEDIYSAYGVKIAGRDIEEFSLSPYSEAAHDKNYAGTAKAVKHGYEIVIERYERPTALNPDGRFTVVAGDKLLYDGALPYLNGDEGTRTYPFVRQTCLTLAGGFFGGCIVDRLIPVQRAYNAVKNRKHEFLNRISMGTIAVEDGSVDTDSLEEDGLMPGKILIYRQGGTPPEMLSLGSVPSEFSEEEDRLIEEFSRISGVGDLTQNTQGFASVTSATGLQLLIEQDEARLNVSYDQIKRALVQIGRHILRLYRQFAADGRLMRYAGENDVLSLFYFKSGDISGDDVVLEADSEINLTPAQRRTLIYDMLDRGLLSDDDGKISASVKNKVLENLGYKGLGGTRDLARLHRVRCGEENLLLKTAQTEVKPYDDHSVHITEHTAFLLTQKLSPEQEKRFIAHLEEHKKLLSEVNNG
ncbi:MAG: hypothetical protein ACI4MH_07630 [Candidatus Coproplasma sp.]